eukprot:1459073-Rhodomonas_salina.3
MPRTVGSEARASRQCLAEMMRRRCSGIASVPEPEPAAFSQAVVVTVTGTVTLRLAQPASEAVSVKVAYGPTRHGGASTT